MTQHVGRSVDLLLRPVKSFRTGVPNVVAVVDPQIGFVAPRTDARVLLQSILASSVGPLTRGVVAVAVREDLLHVLQSGPPATAAHLEHVDLFRFHVAQQLVPGFVLASHGHQVLVRVDKGHPFGRRTVARATGSVGGVLRTALARVLVVGTVVRAHRVGPRVVRDKVGGKAFRNLLQGTPLHWSSSAAVGDLRVVVDVNVIHADETVKDDPLLQARGRIANRHGVPPSQVRRRGPGAGDQMVRLVVVAVVFAWWWFLWWTHGQVGPASGIDNGGQNVLVAKLLGGVKEFVFRFRPSFGGIPRAPRAARSRGARRGAGASEWAPDRGTVVVVS